MANVTIDMAGNPWVITAGGATALPAVLYHKPVLPLRVRWVSPGAAAGDKAIVTDSATDGGTGRRVVDFIANSIDFMYDETRPRGHELYPGMIVTALDSGVLYIFI